MTDKPIMIDDVDVSGCDFLAKEDDYCSYSGVTYAYKGQCMYSDEEMCKEHPKCFYKKVLKQLQTKERECERLNKTINEAKNSKLDLKSFLVGEAIQNEYEQQIDQLKKENEQLKKSVRSNKDKRKKAIEKYLKLKEFTNKEFQELKAENKELETEFDKFEEQIKLQENFIDSFLFATKNSEWRNKSILEDEADAIIEKVESDYVQLDKYKQALQGIKDYCNKYPQNSIGFKKQILQKCEVINE